MPAPVVVAVIGLSARILAKIIRQNKKQNR